jgi:hypothetical protein
MCIVDGDGNLMRLVGWNGKLISRDSGDFELIELSDHFHHLVLLSMVKVDQSVT